MAPYKRIINSFINKNILVIGDVILDQYLKGSVSRISPEAPVPVVLVNESFYKPGGSANVSNNLSQLGANVVQIGRIGDDVEGKILLDELRRSKINTKGLFVDKTMPTISKTRVIAQHQQVVRIDREDKMGKQDGKVKQQIFDFIKQQVKKCDAIILSDYGKGFINEEMIHFVSALSLQEGKILTVDPKVEHFQYYRGVTAITPNLKEAENAIRNIKITSREASRLGIHCDQLTNDQDIDLAGKELLKYLELESLLITLGEHGMRLFENGKKPVYIKTQAQEVYDVTGAGDTVISVYTLALASGATKHQAAELSNMAAGIVVGKMGAVAITKQELLREAGKV